MSASSMTIRGSELRDLCLYEYVKIIRKRPAKNRTGSDIDFSVNHPEYGEKTQVICGPESVKKTVALVGQLSQYQHIEDRVPGAYTRSCSTFGPGSFSFRHHQSNHQSHALKC